MGFAPSLERARRKDFGLWMRSLISISGGMDGSRIADVGGSRLEVKGQRLEVRGLRLSGKRLMATVRGNDAVFARSNLPR